MCDHTFICIVPKEWPYDNVSVTKNVIVKEYKQLKLKRQDGTALGADYYLLYDGSYKLYVFYQKVVQCSWQCKPMTSHFRQHVKDAGGESKELDTIQQQFCLENYMWWDNSRIIGRMTEWPQSLYGQDIFNRRFAFDILSENIKEPMVESLKLI